MCGGGKTDAKLQLLAAVILSAAKNPYALSHANKTGFFAALIITGCIDLNVKCKTLILIHNKLIYLIKYQLIKLRIQAVQLNIIIHTAQPSQLPFS